MNSGNEATKQKPNIMRFSIQNQNKFFSKNFTIAGFNVPHFVDAGSSDVMTFDSKAFAQDFIDANIALKNSRAVLDIFSI